jgi:uncharacterized membrane protein YdjX (TVP38/TMEM64 family)
MNPWSLALADWRAALRQRRGWHWPWTLAALLALLLLALWTPSGLSRLQGALHQAVQQGLAWEAAWPGAAVLVFCALFASWAASRLPGCSLLALAAGALFGPWLGAVLIAVAAALGALGQFYAARWFGREPLRRRFAQQFEAIDQGVQHAGQRYLLLLRLAPVIPYAVVNRLMGLTRMRGWTFFWASALGMAASSVLYALAGAGIGAWAGRAHEGLAR